MVQNPECKQVDRSGRRQGRIRICDIRRNGKTQRVFPFLRFVFLNLDFIFLDLCFIFPFPCFDFPEQGNVFFHH